MYNIWPDAGNRTRVAATAARCALCKQWATHIPDELHTSLWATLIPMSYTHPWWATVHTSLRSYTHPYELHTSIRATHIPNELHTSISATHIPNELHTSLIPNIEPFWYQRKSRNMYRIRWENPQNCQRENSQISKQYWLVTVKVDSHRDTREKLPITPALWVRVE